MALVSATALLGGAGAAMAAQPEPWHITLQPAVTEIMRDITWFNGFTLTIITVIVLFVLALLLWCIFRFNSKANPTPSRTSHNTMIEVVWTIAPILILVVIAIPSFRLLYKEVNVPAYDMTLKVTGYQWYWGYQYADEGMEDVYFDSLLIRDEAERKARAAAFKRPESEYPRLLAVDTEVIVPVDKVVRVQVTAADVIHSFAMPAFGVKIDAIPGRLNETWFKAEKTGIYYGQCSELCGRDHAFMPIAIRVVEQDQYDAWAEAAKTDVEEATNELMAAIAAGNSTADAGASMAVATR
ncbi:MAG: cytochrome c oxidase subunit II [Stappia sp.]|nr:cytochrome c oxidase subunit II [Stappia sp.]MAA96874.1 cytochrome c oxidase subunit II [Stappia sp.]MBM21182.1 cytochrome c oxidase subunit II [Stappia sp.]